MMANAHTSFWNEDRVKKVTELWAEGVSAGMIARRMGAPSRNAVISKVHRLGLAGRGIGGDRKSANRRATTVRINPPRRARELPPPPIEEPAPLVGADGLPITLLNVGFSNCRWPMWDDAERNTFQVCGHQKANGSAYCAFHAAKGRGNGTRSEGDAA